VIDRLRSTGRRVVADLNDNYFEHPFYVRSFRDFVARVDAVVTSTAEDSAQGIGRGSSRNTRWPSVTDRSKVLAACPASSPPARALAQRVPAAGSGNPDEHDETAAARLVRPPEQLENPGAGRSSRCSNYAAEAIELEIITPAPDCGVEEFAMNSMRSMGRRACRLRFTPWSPDATWEGLARAAVVLIPTWSDDASQAVKSPNGSWKATARGPIRRRQSVTGDYRPLAPYCWLGGQHRRRLRWALGASR